MTTNLPQRRSLRLRDYDYSASGAYFVTICTQDRTAMFGEVVNGEMCLNDAGRMIQNAWQNLPERFPGWDIDDWVVMPDHFHGILVRDDRSHRKPPFTRRGGSLCPPGLLDSPGSPCPPGSSGSHPPNMLPDIMQRFKSYTTHQYGRAVAEKGWPSYSQRLWQRSYYEHVIRNEQDLTDIRDYIVNNPISWEPGKGRAGTETRPYAYLPIAMESQKVQPQNDSVGAGHRARPHCENATVPLTTDGCKQNQPMRDDRGFTLIELVVVIVIVGILASLGGRFIVAPVTGYIDLARRTRLVDQAEMAMRRMQRDIRVALPNSIERVSATEIRMINTVDGGRYRRYVDPNVDCVAAPDAFGCDILDFTAADDNSFDVLGSLSLEPTSEQHIVVYNVSPGDTGNMRKVIVGSDKVRIHLEPIINQSEQFPQPSPYQRFFVVDAETTYSCDLANRKLLRTSSPLSGVTPSDALVTTNVKKCEFTYNSSTTQRAGLVTLKLTLSDKEAEEETITLLHQVHVVNAP